MTVPFERLPVAPLLAVGGGVSNTARLITGACRTDRTFASVSRQLNRAVREGGITWPLADRFAIALGHHPASIWGDDWFALDADIFVDHPADENSPGDRPGCPRNAVTPAGTGRAA